MIRERHYAPEAIQSRLQEMEELWEAKKVLRPQTSKGKSRSPQ